ncbi:hypothetical protein [Goodfellowiella coeruleoviolacea]|uniref:PE domain-containing protein n=1 Tax=Goodfellowiella coeruleoviolacea TaxID=334858 RepID=A0AAE3GD06_9PSEU|nr:hypothetical protein [Goodfellowiella coeruleoviolacea]MCP2164982.1 hypothetical protein [Goodfellowiella coeruleoviolacea]
MATSDVGGAIGAAVGAAAGAAVGAAAQRVNFVAQTPVMGAGGALSGVASTNFSVAPDEAERLMNGLLAARDRLEELYNEAGPITEIPSPGKDPYSGYATLATRDTAGDKEGGYRWANKLARDSLQTTIENIDAALKQYRQTEEANQQAFSSGGANQ